MERIQPSPHFTVIADGCGCTSLCGFMCELCSSLIQHFPHETKTTVKLMINLRPHCLLILYKGVQTFLSFVYWGLFQQIRSLPRRNATLLPTFPVNPHYMERWNKFVTACFCPSLAFFIVEDFQGVAVLRLSLLFRRRTGFLSLQCWPFVVRLRCDFEDLVTHLWDTLFI